MTIQKFNYRGTSMNKIEFREIESYLEDKGLNVNAVFEMIADENEYIYVSNGFVSGLEREENEAGEWHHFFKKDVDGHFIAGQMMFNNN
jgi:hypothetical protein